MTYHSSGARKGEDIGLDPGNVDDVHDPVKEDGHALVLTKGGDQDHILVVDDEGQGLVLVTDAVGLDLILVRGDGEQDLGLVIDADGLVPILLLLLLLLVLVIVTWDDVVLGLALMNESHLRRRTVLQAFFLLLPLVLKMLSHHPRTETSEQ